MCAQDQIWSLLRSLDCVGGLFVARRMIKLRFYYDEITSLIKILKSFLLISDACYGYLTETISKFFFGLANVIF